ncbi:uncharacterized protein LOC131006674 isoform X2 [Salvia miltiorrhiza]|uniref:uncharacterized protein LOC131006674 isoform X2 n=1 Tax=Salvia miltiorrhiza TaxID=226208 RepID=UPI0025AB8B2A|nr:uncharacterized protein LOC131006674 isoform X2 [Salvia miltiorrhiza]
MSRSRGVSMESSSRVVDLDSGDVPIGVPCSRGAPSMADCSGAPDYLAGNGVDSDDMIDGGRPNHIILKKNESSLVTLANLQEIWALYDIPDWVSLHSPSGLERADWVLPGWTCMYVQMFKDGCRLPLPRLIVEMCDYHKIPPGQLMPTAWRVLMALQVFGEIYNIDITLVEVLETYHLTSNSGDIGRYMLKVRGNKSPLILGVDTLHTRWKKKYFFVPCEALGLVDGSEISYAWSSANLKNFPYPTVWLDVKERLKKILSYPEEARDWRVILSDDNLRQSSLWRGTSFTSEARVMSKSYRFEMKGPDAA